MLHTLLRIISGAKYSGVPHSVHVRPLTRFANPKSVIWKKIKDNLKNFTKRIVGTICLNIIGIFFQYFCNVLFAYTYLAQYYIADMLCNFSDFY